MVLGPLFQQRITTISLGENGCFTPKGKLMGSLLTVRHLVLCIALSKGGNLSNMDVNNAFLHGIIQKDIYIAQSYGFVHPKKKIVYKLHKSLYNLKQAPQGWYKTLQSFLLTYELINVKFDKSLFNLKINHVITYFIVYANGLLTRNNKFVFKEISSKISLKSLNSPSNILGIEILPTTNELFLTQHHYVSNLLGHFNIHDLKPTFIPMSTYASLMSPTNTPNYDVITYKHLIGSVQYLPNITFTVNKLSE
ncbi:hypothetical protein CR513_32615, partial [Mucuna pruriens]